MAEAASESSTKALSAARAAPKADAIARVVADVLLRQAEKRVQLPPPDLVGSKARELDLETTDGKTPFGNVLLAIERGPEGSAETEIVEAFLGLGVGLKLEGLEAEPRATAIRGLLPSLDWLQAWTAYDVYAAIDDALASGAAAFWEIAIADLGSGPAPSRAALAQRILRVEALRASGVAERESLLARAAQGAADPAVRALAGGESALGQAVPKVSGRSGGRPPTPLRRLVALGTGYAAVTGLFGFLGRLLLGWRRTVVVSLVHRGLKVERRVDLLGRTIRQSEEVVPFGSVALVARETRFPYLYLLVGVAGMTLGATWGVFRIVDSIRGAYLPLAIVGLVAVAAGVAFDLALFSIWPWRKGRTALWVLQKPKKWWRVLDVAEGDAKALLAAVTERLRATR